MRLDITLNKSDIEKAIAFAYNTKPENVKVFTQMKRMGQALSKTRVICAEIKTPMRGNDGCTYPDCFNCEREDCTKTITSTTDEKIAHNIKQRYVHG